MQSHTHLKCYFHSPNIHMGVSLYLNVTIHLFLVYYNSYESIPSF